MSREQDNTLIEEITEILGQDGLSQPEENFINAAKAHTEALYGDAPPSVIDGTAKEVEQTLYQLGSPAKQELLFKLMNLETQGMDGHFAGISVHGSDTPAEERETRSRTRRTLNNLIAQEIMAEAMREFDIALKTKVAAATVNVLTIHQTYSDSKVAFIHQELASINKVQETIQQAGESIHQAIQELQQDNPSREKVKEKIDTAEHDMENFAKGVQDLQAKNKERMSVIDTYKSEADSELERMKEGILKGTDPELVELGLLLAEDLKQGKRLDIQTNPNYKKWVEKVDALEHTNPEMFRRMNIIENSLNAYKDLSYELRFDFTEYEIKNQKLSELETDAWRLKHELSVLDPNDKNKLKLIEQLQKIEEQRKEIETRLEQIEQKVLKQRQDMKENRKDLREALKALKEEKTSETPSAAPTALEKTPKGRPAKEERDKTALKNTIMDGINQIWHIAEKAIGRTVLVDDQGRPVHKGLNTNKYYIIEEDGTRQYLTPEDQARMVEKDSQMQADKKKAEEAPTGKTAEASPPPPAPTAPAPKPANPQPVPQDTRPNGGTELSFDEIIGAYHDTTGAPNIVNDFATAHGSGTAKAPAAAPSPHTTPQQR